MRKCYQNDAQMRSKINGKSMNFQNLRFLVFCEEYNVKIVFLHDQGYQKSIKSQSKINANSMLEKVMPKRCQHDRKWVQNRFQIDPTLTPQRPWINLELAGIDSELIPN